MGCGLRFVACALTLASAMLGAAGASEERLRPGFAGEPGALLAAAEHVVNAEPQRALDLTAQVLDETDAALSAEFLARLHYVRARASTHKGRHADAIAESALALELLGAGAPALRADILTTMSISLGRSRETRRAFELQQEALSIWRDLKDLSGEATSLSALAELYFDIGHKEKGIATFDEAVARARDASDPRALVVTLNNFAYFLQLEGNYPLAATHIDEALGLVGDAKSRRLEAYVLLTAALVRERMGLVQEASALLRRGLPIAEELAHPVLLLSANLTLARLARNEGSLNEALTFAERSLRYARDVNNERQLSEITRLLADINEELGNHEAAYGYLRGHAAHLAADAASASARSAALFEAETQLAERDQEMELLRRDSKIAGLAVARAEILRNAAILSALLLAAGLAALALLLREKARAKASIEVKNRELVAAYDKLETANRNKSAFLRVMSHELKTPLNAIIGFSDLLARASMESSASEFARIVNAQGRNLLRMVSEILLFTGAADQEIALDTNLEKIMDILDRSIQLTSEIRPGAEERIDITAIDAEVTVSCDLNQLANCVARLLDNAMKFSPQGSRVSLSALRTGAGDLEIAVGDDGPGINGDDIPKMFEVLSQADQSLARTQQGAGLGLPIASRIAEAHGGHIAVSRKPSGGAIVMIILPASRLVAAADQAAAA